MNFFQSFIFWWFVQICNKKIFGKKCKENYSRLGHFQPTFFQKKIQNFIFLQFAQICNKYFFEKKIQNKFLDFTQICNSKDEACRNSLDGFYPLYARKHSYPISLHPTRTHIMLNETRLYCMWRILNIWSLTIKNIIYYRLPSLK